MYFEVPVRCAQGQRNKASVIMAGNYPLDKMCTVWMKESISHCSVAALVVIGLIHMTAIFNLVLTKGCEIWWYCKCYKPQINLSNFLLWLVSDYLSFLLWRIGTISASLTLHLLTFYHLHTSNQIVPSPSRE